MHEPTTENAYLLREVWTYGIERLESYDCVNTECEGKTIVKICWFLIC